MTRLWDKGAPLDARVLAYTAGEDHALDERLVRHDIRASIAHADMLAEQGLLSAAEVWGESLAATSDYLIRGISRSDQHAALQADVHVASESGFIGGVFASSVQFDSADRRSAELSCSRTATDPMTPASNAATRDASRH